ncbi:transposase, partial [Dialister hominis]
TSNGFHKIVEKAGLVHSMSRVGCCADNGLMEGFWGMLKRERYYTRKFTSRKAVVSMINGYIYFYNNKRIQRKLHLLAPMEVFNAAPMAA